MAAPSPLTTPNLLPVADSSTVDMIKGQEGELGLTAAPTAPSIRLKSSVTQTPVPVTANLVTLLSMSLTIGLDVVSSGSGISPLQGAAALSALVAPGVEGRGFLRGAALATLPHVTGLYGAEA